MSSFYIWGTGYRAENIKNFIKDEDIIAYIDNDETKQGLLYCGKKIISFEEYLKKSNKGFIIVTPVLARNEISKQLDENGIKQYFMLDMCPSEMLGYGTKVFLKYALAHASKTNVNVLLGNNLYTYILYKAGVSEGYSMKVCCEDAELARRMSNLLDVQLVSKHEIKSDYKVLRTSRYDYIENIEQRINHKIVDVYDLSDDIKEYHNPDVENFKNIHLGERCVIVATGPSLKVDDLKILKDNKVKTFGVNRIFNIDTNVWVPDYYVFVDRKGLTEYWHEIANYLAPIKFVDSSFADNDCANGSVMGLHVVTGDAYDLLPSFSEDVAQKVYGAATVVYTAIQIAVYMGFKEIYLLGVDCNYKKNSFKNYFFNDGKQDKIPHDVSQMLDAFVAAKKYADKQGIKIYNATRGGMLDIFERVNFDSVFA